MHEFYGDQIRWFLGVVEEIGTDEPKLGRVRVRIYGIHGDREEVPISSLPQAQVVVPTTEPGVSGQGRNPYLQVGATVFGIFLDGKNSQLPLVIGSIPVIEVPSQEQRDNDGPQVEKASLPNQKSVTPRGDINPSTQDATINSTAKYGNSAADQWSSEEIGDFESRRQIAWESFTNWGWSPEAASGIIGNLIAESNLVPAAKGDIGLHSPTDVSYGIAQWYNGTPRFDNLVAFAKKRGKPPSDYYTQLAFVDHELQTISYLGGPELKKAKTPTQAALIIHRKYERPALTGGLSPIDGKPSRLHEQKRVDEANKAYNSFSRRV